jgi:hypothetical protein
MASSILQFLRLQRLLEFELVFLSYKVIPWSTIDGSSPRGRGTLKIGVKVQLTYIVRGSALPWH